MNERIKSLLERAEYQAQKHSGSDWEVYVEPSREQILEKFAELIVQECIDIIASYTVRMSRPGEEYLHPILEIKDRFGV
jgi:uncharacterized protein YutE (UPF0331/DUF86 family)